MASYYHGLNRNKRTQELDLTQPQDQGKLLTLISEADVVIENFKTGTMERWGIGYGNFGARPLYEADLLVRVKDAAG